MENEYRPELKAQVTVDDDGIVRHLLHTEEPWRPPTEGALDPLRAAVEYIRAQSGLLGIADATLEGIDERVSYAEPRMEQDSYRLVDQKQQFDSATFAFAQTYLNVPVWRRGISVTVKRDSSGVVESTNTTLPGVQVGLPSGEAIDRWRDVADRGAGDAGAEAAGAPGDQLVADALGLSGEEAAEADAALPDAAQLHV